MIILSLMRRVTLGAWGREENPPTTSALNLDPPALLFLNAGITAVQRYTEFYMGVDAELRASCTLGKQSGK